VIGDLRLMIAVHRLVIANGLIVRCHPEPFACHSERSDESPQLAQGKLREGSPQFVWGTEHQNNCKDPSLRSE
jgi:hypothetical protein